MNCNDLDRALSEAVPLTPQAQEHASSCNRCQRMVGAFNTPADADGPSPATLRHIAQGMGVNLRPVRPVAPARYFVGAFIAVFVSIVAIGVYRLGALAIPVMTPFQTAAILGALAIGAGLLVYSLVSQMIPGSLYKIRPALLPVGIAIFLFVAITVVFPFQHERNFWGSAWWCIRTGASIGGLAGVPVWLMLRRGAILSPRMTVAATGLLAGLAGTTLLTIHCPNLDAWHILVAHLGAAILCALAGLVTGALVEINGIRSTLNRS